MKKNLIITAIIVLWCCNAFAQSNRNYDSNYMWTTFVEDFIGSTLDSNEWVPATNFKRGLGFLVNKPSTIAVNNGTLDLKMQYSPNYLDSIWKTSGWEHVYSNYIGGEISSIKEFTYGSFECSAKYAYQRGSWPAF